MHRQGFPPQLGNSQSQPRGCQHGPTSMYNVDVILHRANAFTTKRYGINLSARQLRRMVSLGLVPGPKPVGRRRGLPPEWQWSPVSYRRVLQVCRMKKRGFKRTNAIIFDLWLGGAACEFSDVRTAALGEFRRLRKAVSRRVPTTWDPRVEGEEMAPRSRAAVHRGLGSEQTAFPVFPSEAFLQLAGAMLFGVQTRTDVMLSLFPGYGVPEALIDELRSDELMLADLGLGLRALAGLAADPEESEFAAETALETADEETFTNIRDYAREASWMYGVVPVLMTMMYSQTRAESATLRHAFANATKVLGDPAFRLLHFVIMLRRAQLKGDHGRGIGTFARLLLRPFHRLMVFVSSDMETRTLLLKASKHIGIEQGAPLAIGLFAPPPRQVDPVLRAITWKLIRTTWRYGLSDLWKLRKLSKGDVASDRKSSHAVLPSTRTGNSIE